MLMNWIEQISNLYGFEWHPINQALDIYHQLEDFRLKVSAELLPLGDICCERLPWNLYTWVSTARSYIESATDLSLVSVKDVCFGPYGVVLEIVTSDGKYFFKACHLSSIEPALSKLLSSALQEYCDEVLHVNETLGCFITKDRGPSVNLMLDLAVEDECRRLLASMQISSIERFDQILACGVLDARPEKIVFLLSELMQNLSMFLRE